MNLLSRVLVLPVMNSSEPALNFAVETYNASLGKVQRSRASLLKIVLLCLEANEIPDELENLPEALHQDAELGRLWDSVMKTATEENGAEAFALCQKLEELVADKLEQPERRLACYGSLRPGQKNHHIVADIAGQWLPGTIYGETEEEFGYPVFTWQMDGNPIAVEVLCSEQLPANYPRIDEFEGFNYRRVLVPVKMKAGFIACSLYARKLT